MYITDTDECLFRTVRKHDVYLAVTFRSICKLNNVPLETIGNNTGHEVVLSIVVLSVGYLRLDRWVAMLMSASAPNMAESAVTPCHIKVTRSCIGSALNGDVKLTQSINSIQQMANVARVYGLDMRLFFLGMSVSGLNV